MKILCTCSVWFLELHKALLSENKSAGAYALKRLALVAAKVKQEKGLISGSPTAAPSGFSSSNPTQNEVVSCLK